MTFSPEAEKENCPPLYHREADLEIFQKRWVEAILDNDSDFQQELNPFTGESILSVKSKPKDYTPALLILPDYGKKHPELLT